MIWHNFGDVSFVEHGGCLVKPHHTKRELLDYPNLSSQYDVLWCNPSPDKDDTYCAALCTVDLDDYKTNFIVQAKTSAETAACIVEYYGCLPLGGRSCSNSYPSKLSDVELSYNDLCQWLQQLGADEFIPEEYIQKIAYEEYKIDWMARHHLTMRIISNTVEQFNEYLTKRRRLGETITGYSFADYVDEYGFDGGIIWACYNEFCAVEYMEEGYMEEILKAKDFVTYEILRRKNTEN